MKQGFVKVGAATPQVTVADPAANAAEILRAIRKMEESKVKVMVFPELCLTGYTCGDLFLQKRLLDEAMEQLAYLQEQTRDTDALIFIGMPLEVRGRLYDTAAVISRGALLGFVPKKYLSDQGPASEGRYFTQGSESVIYLDMQDDMIPFGTNLLFVCEGLPHLTVAAEIGDDLAASCPPSAAHAAAGAVVIANPTASPEMAGKDAWRRMLACAHSGTSITAYVSASAGEGESTTDLVFGGQNMIIENGKILAESRRFENQIVITDIDTERVIAERIRTTTYPASASEIVPAEYAEYLEIPFSLVIEETELTRTFDPMPFVPEGDALRKERCEEILQIQALGLKKRLQHIHAESAVVGISGGLDSTLALLVTGRAFDMLGLPRKNILSITMPGFGTTDRTYDNACTLTRRLGATLREIPIRDAVTVHFQDIGQDIMNHDVTYENAQARERTQILMDVANQTNALVVGTGDLSELALGWATYNGDHMSMYGVNGAIPKTLVRHLVRYCADTCGDPQLSESLLDILDTPVSPELLPPQDGVISQKTEELVGPYELHDFFLYYMLRAGYEPAKLRRIANQAFAGTYGDEEILKWLKKFCWRFFSQQFKRSCLPDGPAVGTVGVSPRGGLRMPSDAAAAAWIRQLEEM